MNNRDLINSIFSELRTSLYEKQQKYRRLAFEEAKDNHQEAARKFIIVAQTYERALSKVIEVEVNTRIMVMKEEEEDDRRS